MHRVSAAKFITELGAATDTEQQPHSWPTHKQAVNTAASRAAGGMGDAYERGVMAGKAAALAEIETRLEAERVYYAQQLALERFTWANREAEKLAEQFIAGIAAIETDVVNATARILKPFLTESIHRQAIDGLVEALEVLIGKNQGITLEIFGPEDLLQLIREKLSDRNVAALFSPAEGVDVRVVAGHTILETSLEGWMAQLRRE